MRTSICAGVLVALISTAGVAAGNDDAGVRFRVDALLLDAHIAGNNFGSVFPEVPSGTYFGGSLDGGLQGGWRIVAEAENQSGLGVRFQYFEFDNAVSYQGEWENGVSLIFGGDIGVDVYAVDIEATQRATFRKWDLVVGGGLRAGGVDISQGGGLFTGLTSFYGVRSGADFDGVGPTVSLAAERPLGGSGLSVIGRARASLLFGEVDQVPTFGVTPFPPVIPTRTTDDLVQVTEIQFGMNYEREFGAATGTFGVFWEAQRWDSDSNTTGDLGLHGLSLQSGLEY